MAFILLFPDSITTTGPNQYYKTRPLKNRPDLPNHAIVLLLVSILAGLVIVLSPVVTHKPGSVNGQWAGVFGLIALTAPMLFSLMKRSGFSASPPFWFVSHVLSACLGVYFILFHAANGNWLSPPGVVLMLLLLLIFQGALLRTSLSSQFSRLFARSAMAGGFSQPKASDKQHLQAVIERKQRLLLKLNSNASEALFSPNLFHWLRHPWLSLNYQILIDREARMIGARESAGFWLAWSRRLHMVAAGLFYIGLLSHVIVVLFFAGYAAGDAEIDWWYITAWGR